jgi:hypothetical protein
MAELNLPGQAASPSAPTRPWRPGTSRLESCPSPTSSSRPGVPMTAPSPFSCRSRRPLLLLSSPQNSSRSELAVNLAQQPRRQFTQPHGFSLCRALGVLDEMPQQQQRRPSLRRTRQDGPHAIDLRSICASSSKPAVSSSLSRVL